MKINIPFEISDEIINNALIGAREGATGYWARSRLFTQDNDIDDNGAKLWNNAEYQEGKEARYQSFFCIEEGGDPEKELFVTREAIERGLTIMANEYGKHFADLINENDDAITHDVFLQCCLLNKVIYG